MREELKELFGSLISLDDRDTLSRIILELEKLHKDNPHDQTCATTIDFIRANLRHERSDAELLDQLGALCVEYGIPMACITEHMKSNIEVVLTSMTSLRDKGSLNKLEQNLNVYATAIGISPKIVGICRMAIKCIDSFLMGIAAIRPVILCIVDICDSMGISKDSVPVLKKTKHPLKGVDTAQLQKLIAMLEPSADDNTLILETVDLLKQAKANVELLIGVPLDSDKPVIC